MLGASQLCYIGDQKVISVVVIHDIMGSHTWQDKRDVRWSGAQELVLFYQFFLRCSQGESHFISFLRYTLKVVTRSWMVQSRALKGNKECYSLRPTTAQIFSKEEESHFLDQKRSQIKILPGGTTTLSSCAGLTIH